MSAREPRPEPPRTNGAWKPFRIALGVVLIVLGAVMGFLPILQGWVFVLAGLALIAPYSERVRRWREALKARFRSRG